MTQTVHEPAVGGSGAPGVRSSPVREVALLAAACLAILSQLYIVLPLLPDIAAETQVSTNVASWTITAFGGGYAVGFLVLSPLSARFGYRRTMVAAIVATAALTLLTTTMPTISLIIGFRVLQGFVAAALPPTALAYLSEHIPAQRRPLAFACLTSSFIGAAVVAQVFGQLLAGQWGWRTAMLTAGVLLALMALPMRLGLRPDAAHRAVSPRTAYRGVLAAAVTPRLLPLYLAAATLLFGFVGVYAAIQVANPLDLAANPVTLLTLRASALPAVVAAPFAMHWLRDVPPGRRLVLTLGVAAVFLGAAAVSVPLTGSIVLLGVLVGCFVLAGSLAAPSAIQATTARAGENVAGAAAMYSFWLYVGSSAAAPVATALGSLGFTGMTVFFAVVLALGAVAALLAARAARFPRPAQPSPPATSSEP